MPDNNALLASLFQRARLWMAGLQFSGRRDLYQIFGWQRYPLHLDYVARYIRQDIAKRVIDAPVLATWSDAPNVDGGQTFNDAWKAVTTDMQIAFWAKVIRLDKLAGLGAMAGLVIGFDDGSSSLEAPVRPAANGNGRKVLYLQPYAEACISVTEYNKDPKSPRYGLPEIYTIQPGRFSAEIRVGSIQGLFTSEVGRPPFKVHYSRFLCIAENLLEDNVYGRSRMEVVTNVLDDIMKVAGGSAETFWMIANRGMQVDVDKEMDLDANAEQSLTQEIEEYQHELRRFIRTRGVQIKELGANNVDPRGVFEVLLALVSAATGIPKLVLIGSSTGTLSSQQDRGNWSDRVAERVTEYAEPTVLVPFIALLINAGVLPQPVDFSVTWPEAFKMNPLERAQTSAQMARSAANLTKTMSLLAPKTPDVVDPATGKVTPGQPIPQEPLFSRDEMRNIVGFGKRMPVFDSGDGSAPASTITTSADTAASLDGGDTTGD